MRKDLVTFVGLCAIGAVALGGFAIAAVAGFSVGQANGAATSRHLRGQHLVLDRIDKALNLTVEQEATIRPGLDQAQVRLVAIRTDARKQARAVIDDTMSQLEPLLTAEQKTAFTELQKARQDMHEARDKLLAAMKE